MSPHFSAALLARDLGDDGPGHGAHVRVRPDLRARHRRRRGQRAAVAGGPPAARRRAARPPRRRTSRRGRPGRALPVRASGEALLHRALAATTSGVTIADLRQPDQPLVYVNEAFAEMAGFPSSRSSAATAGSCRAPTPTPLPCSGSAARVDAGEECRETLLNYRGPERTPWWNEVFLSPVVDEQGRVPAVHRRPERRHGPRRGRARPRARARPRRELPRAASSGSPRPTPSPGSRTGAAWRSGSTRRCGRPRPTTPPSRSCSSTSTASSGSTTGTATRRRPAAGPPPSACAARLRRGDLLARLGGDEFLVGSVGLGAGDSAGSRRSGSRQRAGRAPSATPVELRGHSEVSVGGERGRRGLPRPTARTFESAACTARTLSMYAHAATGRDRGRVALDVVATRPAPVASRPRAGDRPPGGPVRGCAPVPPSCLESGASCSVQPRRGGSSVASPPSASAVSCSVSSAAGTDRARRPPVRGQLHHPDDPVGPGHGGSPVGRPAVGAGGRPSGAPSASAIWCSVAATRSARPDRPGLGVGEAVQLGLVLDQRDERGDDRAQGRPVVGVLAPDLTEQARQQDSGRRSARGRRRRARPCR